MARLGLFEGKQQKYMDFDSDTEVLIAFLDKEQIMAIRKKGSKQARLSGGDEDVITNRLIGEAACLGWRKKTDHNHPGLLTSTGVAIPFSNENRDMLMKKSREFSNFVNDAAMDSIAFLEDETDPAELAAAKEE